MKSILEIRKDARQAMRRGRSFAFWTSAVCAIFAIVAFMFLICIFSEKYIAFAVGCLLTLFVVVPMSCNYSAIMRVLAGSDCNMSVSRLFDFLENGTYWRDIFLFLLKNVLVLLGLCLLVVPGIWLAYSYSMCYFVAADHPDWSALECLRFSRKLTKNQVGKLILLDLTFVGWLILGFFTSFIAHCWMVPLHQVARVKFYEELEVEIVVEKPKLT